MKLKNLKIEMQPNNCHTKERCSITGEIFKSYAFIFTIVEGDLKGRHVSEDVALYHGFTMSEELFFELVCLYGAHHFGEFKLPGKSE